MTVEKADVIDFMVRSPKTNEVLLVMVEVRDQNAAPEALQQLQVKFRRYAEYVMSGALARQYPDMADSPIAIRLDHFTPLNDAAIGVLRQWAGRLSGIKVGVCSHRLYWNPILSFFHKLASKLLGSEHGVVRWAAERGSAPPLVTRAQFTDEFAAALRTAMPKAQVDLQGDLGLRVIGPNGMDTQGNLDNAYKSYWVVPENKEEIIRKFVASFRETCSASTNGIDRSRIVPILKDKAWVEEVNQSVKARSQANAIASVHEAYNEELTIVYAEDTPTNVRYLTADGFAGLKMERKELLPLACANLQRLLALPNIQAEDGLYRIKAGGDYDACVLLLEDFWTQANIPVEGELVAAVPARDFLVVTGSNDTEAVSRLKHTAQAVASQASYRLTAKLFVRRNGKFVVYED